MPNAFGLKKIFDSTGPPDHDPDSALKATDFYDSNNHAGESMEPSGDDGDSNEPSGDTATSKEPSRKAGEASQSSAKASKALSFGPFPNLSSFELGEWFYGQGTQKSIKDFKSLVKVLTSPNFSIADIKKTSWTTVFQNLGKNKEEIDPRQSDWVDDVGWKTTDIELDVPVHHRMERGRGIEKAIVGKLYHRSIVSIVEEKIRNEKDHRLFHHEGFELSWKPDATNADSPEFRVLSELYTSDAFLKAQKEVRESPPPQIKDCTLPRVVVGLMFWSDTTHISTFSPQKVWPLYMLFANESKYKCGRGVSENHVAYFDIVSGCLACLSFS